MSDMTLTEYMGLRENSATTAFHLANKLHDLTECMTLAEILATTIFSVKLMHDCMFVCHDDKY